MNENLNEFNWTKYENWTGAKLAVNSKITGQDCKTKVYSHEAYAQDIFNVYSSLSPKTIGKDLNNGDTVPVINMSPIDDSRIMLHLSGGLSVDIDLNREKKFIQLFGFAEISEFMRRIKNKEYLDTLLEQGVSVIVTESYPSIRVSLWQGYIKKIKDEFVKEIKSPSKAYMAKILQTNRGGFFVEVQGVDAFMPGSLAAPNKIMDFQSYLGKEVIVMVEDFLPDMNSFIMSHKKYIEYILPKKMSELDLTKKYYGTITGSSKYGIFIEFDEMFTGLLHKSKMKENTLLGFNNNSFKPGHEIGFYISEISKDNRIILTEESLDEKKFKVTKFVEENKNKCFTAEVAALMNFGIIVNSGEISGVIPNKEFKKIYSSPKNFALGDKIPLQLLEVKEDDKLLFTFFVEKKQNKEV